MIEGLWSIEFGSRETGYVGSGVVVFETERVFGGDGQYYYLGKYEIDRNDIIIVKAEIVHFAGDGNSIFGLTKKHSVILRGKIQDKKFVLEGHLIENTNLTMMAKVTKRAELP